MILTMKNENGEIVTKQISILPKNINLENVFCDYDNSDVNVFINVNNHKTVCDEINAILSQRNDCRSVPQEFALSILATVIDSENITNIECNAQASGQSFYSPIKLECNLTDYEKLLLSSIGYHVLTQ